MNLRRRYWSPGFQLGVPTGSSYEAEAWHVVFGDTGSPNTLGTTGLGTIFGIVYVPAFLNDGGNVVRLTLICPNSLGGTMTAMWIGHQAPSPTNVCDFDTNQVQVFFGGSASVVLPTNGADVVSDEVIFTLDPTKPLVVRFSNTGTVNMGQYTGVPIGSALLYNVTSVSANLSGTATLRGVNTWMPLVKTLEAYY